MKDENSILNNEQKTEMKKKRRKKRAKLFVRILESIFAVILVFVIVTTLISVIGLNANVKKANSFPTVHPENYIESIEYKDERLYITSDDTFKVVQLTDVHFGGGWMSLNKDSMAMNAVAAMLTAEKPDLVIVTGDVAYPVPFQAGTFNNKSGAKLFAELMESLGIYWTIGFGNHDTEAYSYYSREEIADFYSNFSDLFQGSYPHCLLQKGPDDVDGVGNQVISIKNSDGVITRSLFVVDSHSYIDGDMFGIMWKYDNIHENQIEWYKNQLLILANENQQAVAKLDKSKQTQYERFTKTVPSSLFLHIPLTEYKTAWNEYIENGEHDTADVKYIYGVAGEDGKVIYSGIHEDEMFETMLDIGSTDTVFCGHDHLNNFSVDYKGIRLTYGMSVDYLAYRGIYKLGSQRGCTVIDYLTDGSVDYHSESYYQDKYTSLYTKESVTMQEITNQNFLGE